MAAAGTGGPLLIQAREQLSMAEREAGRWTMFSSTEKWEKAADHYRKAGNFFKAAMKWEEATHAFKEAAALFGKLREPSEELQMLREAATSLTHKDAKEAARMLEDILVPRLVDAGKLDEVGRMHLQIAESLDGEDVDAAMEHYRNAMNMFTSAGAASEALKCKIKLGQELGRQEMYDEAVDMFVQAAEGRLAKELTRLSARDHFLDAGICVLAKGDSVHARECLDRWCGMDYTFEDSREGRLFAKLIEVVEESKPEEFADAVYAFDSIKKLNPWRTKLLLRVKDAIAGGEDGDIADDLT